MSTKTRPIVGLPEISTSAELAAWLQIPLPTLYSWRAKGRGPRGVRVGRHTRYLRSDIEAWLDANAASQPAGDAA